MSARLSPRRHGGNKDEQAQSLSRWLDASNTDSDAPILPCPYPAHRVTDWRLVDGGASAVCGICHPPAGGLNTVAVVA